MVPHFGWASLGKSVTLYALPTVRWCAWRWHRMGSEPTALPVGRLA